jgi:hypothetical protein
MKIADLYQHVTNSIVSDLEKGVASCAMAVMDDAVFIANARTIADTVTDNRLPSVGFVNFAQVGGLIGYGVDFPDLWYRARILGTGFSREPKRQTYQCSSRRSLSWSSM